MNNYNEYMQNIVPRKGSVKYCPPREWNIDNKLYQYQPTFEGNTGSNPNDS